LLIYEGEERGVERFDVFDLRHVSDVRQTSQIGLAQERMQALALG